MRGALPILFCWLAACGGSSGSTEPPRAAPSPSPPPVDPCSPERTMDGFIHVTQPAPNDTVPTSFALRGCANVFEANVSFRVERDGALAPIAEGFTTATCGTGCVGRFDRRVDLPPDTSGAVTLVVFEASARDGTPVNVNRVPLVVQP